MSKTIAALLAPLLLAGMTPLASAHEEVCIDDACTVGPGGEDLPVHLVVCLDLLDDEGGLRAPPGNGNPHFLVSNNATAYEHCPEYVEPA